jgi:PPOX class probable F420-dependent enzyme
VELQKVVSGRNQAPFRACGRPASSFEALDPTVRLDLRKDGFDHALAFGIELATRLGDHHSAHEVIGPAEPGLAWPVSGGVGGDDLRTAATQQTILLTTYKRDGTPVATPVSIAFDGDRAFFRSYHKAWKTKRLRNNPQLEAAPCTLRGQPTGPAIRARAALLSGDDARLAARSLARGHRVLQAALVPLTHRLMRFRTLHYELLPAESRHSFHRRPPR